jgi:hypothetical protein
MVMSYLNRAHPTAPHNCTMAFEHGPHTILSKVLAEAMQHKLNFRVGFKLEFILLEQFLEVYVLVVSSGTLAMRRLRNKCLPLLEESVMPIHSEQRNGLPMHFSAESSNEESVPDKSLAGLLKHL